MKASSWRDCVESGSAIKVSPPVSKAKSLTKTASARLAFLKANRLGPANASFIFEGCYASALELAHAHALMHGFRVDNHVCLGLYLRDALGRADLYRVFEDCRYKRNSLVYYGIRMNFAVAKATLAKLGQLIQELQTMLR